MVGDALKDLDSKNEIEKGIVYEIDCKFIDLRAAKLEQKIDYLKERSALSKADQEKHLAQF